MNWIDPQTKEILQKEPEPKLAPPKAGEFALVLLRRGPDEQRLVRAIGRINQGSQAEAMVLARWALPTRINSNLTQEEALWGQFELICCDSIALFVRSEVLSARHKGNYLADLFQQVLESPEFQEAKLDIFDVPETDLGHKFVDQFLGSPTLNRRHFTNLSVWVSNKKARIMKHWAVKVGAQIRLET